MGKKTRTITMWAIYYDDLYNQKEFVVRRWFVEKGKAPRIDKDFGLKAIADIDEYRKYLTSMGLNCVPEPLTDGEFLIEAWV